MFTGALWLLWWEQPREVRLGGRAGQKATVLVRVSNSGYRARVGRRKWEGVFKFWMMRKMEPTGLMVDWISV